MCFIEYIPRACNQKVCPDCKLDYDKLAGRERYKKNIEVQRERRKQRFKNLDLRRRVLLNAKSRSIKNNIEFNISVEDIEIPEYCPALGIKLDLDRSNKWTSPSIDKIIPSQGYTKNNIQILSTKANLMKSNATPEELQKFAQWILKTYPI